jgi:RimJ/RimL family protein N-acetyltransferase
MTVALRTARLLLREWCDDDAAAFATMSTHPAVMRYLPPADTGWVPRVRTHWREHGFGQFVVELPGEAPFIGVVGLAHVRFAAPFTPAVEAAWRLVPAY